MPTTAPTFTEWYAGRHPGRTAAPWLDALAGQLAAGRAPERIAAGTGTGKTGAIDAWAWALATTPDTVTRRIVWAVDRRVVVEQTLDDLNDLVAWLDTDHPAARWTADRLRALYAAAPDDNPLAVRRLRGGVERDQLRDLRPDQPAAIVGTVDQVGSRLLLRGYGVSRWARPIEAAAVGYDAWLVVDEADIAGGLVRTAKAVAGMRPDGRSLRVTECSATVLGADGTADDDTIRTGPADLAHPVIGPRLTTPRTLTTAAKFDAVTIAKHVTGEQTRATKAAKAAKAADTARAKAEAALARARTENQTAAAEAALAKARAATAAVGPASAPRVLVVANTVATARTLHDQLAARFPRAIVMLVTGRIRPADADRVRDQLLDLARTGSPGPDRTVIVVATQTVEVGADIDCDLLVTECPDWRALRQRVGRAGRSGQGARIVVAKPSNDAETVYGTAPAGVWTWLTATSPAPVGKKKGDRLIVDLAPAAVDTALALYGPPDGQTTPPAAQLLTRHAAHRLAVTGGRIDDTADVSVYLRVPDDDLTVHVVWRDHLADVDTDTTAARGQWTGPITAAEACPVPIRQAARWAATLPAGHHVVLRGGHATDDPRIRPGDVIVADSRCGGHDQWGWAPDDPAPVEDLSLHPSDGRRAVIDRERWTDTVLDHPAAGDLDLAGRLLQLNAGRNVRTVTVPTAGPVAVTIRTTTTRDQSPIVSLDQHLADVGWAALQIARNLHIGPAETLALAGAAHDLGKLDPRFQTYLGVPAGGEAMAKAVVDLTDPAARRAAATAAGWPRGARHETGSLRQLTATGPVDPMVAHLVASHHGRYRGGWHPIEDEGGLGGIDLDQPARWAALLDEHGPWRLAWLEWVLRSADGWASRQSGIGGPPCERSGAAPYPGGRSHPGHATKAAP